MRFRLTARCDLGADSARLCTVELVLKTRKIIWEDWVAKEADSDGKEQVVTLSTPRSWAPLTWAQDTFADWLQAKLISLTCDL